MILNLECCFVQVSCWTLMGSWLINDFYILNSECCKCVRMRFHCANSLVVVTWVTAHLSTLVLKPGLWSRYLNFRLQVQSSEVCGSGSTSKSFWLKLFGPLKTENHCVICTTLLPLKLGLWHWNPNSWLQLHNLKFRLQSSKIASAPQPWLKPREEHSTSFAEERRAGTLIISVNRISLATPDTLRAMCELLDGLWKTLLRENLFATWTFHKSRKTGYCMQEYRLNPLHLVLNYWGWLHVVWLASITVVRNIVNKTYVSICSNKREKTKQTSTRDQQVCFYVSSPFDCIELLLQKVKKGILK